MSVINRMLQELERRHEAPPAPGLVRAVAAPRPRRWPWFVLGAMVLTGGAGAAAWLLLRPSQAVPPTPGAVARSSAPERPAISVPPAGEIPVAASTEAVASPAAVEHEPALRAAAEAERQPRMRPKPKLLGMGGANVQAAAPDPAAAAPAPSTPEPAPPSAIVKRLSPSEVAEQRYGEALALLESDRAKNAELAVQRLQEALAAFPQHVAAREALAVLLAKARRYAEAERLIEDGLEQGFAPARLTRLAARIRVERGDLAGALALLESAAVAGAKDGEYQALWAAIAARAGRYEVAAERYSVALALEPGRASWWVGLALAQKNLGQIDAARAAFEQARKTPGLASELSAFVDVELAKLGSTR